MYLQVFNIPLLLALCITTFTVYTEGVLQKASSITTETAQAITSHECGSIDIRNHCDSFKQLENCTVITGYLLIVLLPRMNQRNHEVCNFSKYQFPLLREITDFLIFHEVRNITTITDMFPKLTVIRGQRLFLNYALGVTSMRDLIALEFRSLIAIQRGHVFIGTNPKLCNLEKINWDRLTLSPGENHINLVNPEQCHTRSACRGCHSSYCWSDHVCQKFENDNILNVERGTENCHKQCLGGCLDNSPKTCTVCRKWTDNDTCVEKCPVNKFASPHYLRCYTREECTGKKNLYIYKNLCVLSCPSGYVVHESLRECVQCNLAADCIKICNPPNPSQPFWLLNLGDVEDIKGCQVLNGSVFLTIRNRINENDLFQSLADVKEVRGHLNIYKNTYLSSLTFLKGLRKIHGENTKDHHFSLTLYDNKNLRELWSPSEDLELINGGMYVQANYKLCNRFLKQFVEDVTHDKTMDSLQTSDQEVLCAPAKLNAKIEVLSHRSIKFSWPKKQTSLQIEFILRPIPHNKSFDENLEADTKICDKVNWLRILKFTSELSQNGSFYYHKIVGLEANTKYACLVKTFGVDGSYEARSDLTYVITQKDIPPSPQINVTQKTDTSLTLQWSYEDVAVQQTVDYYKLVVYDLPDNKTDLDKRDYCTEPAKMYSTLHEYEDYDTCCERREEEREETLFQNMMQETYACSRDHAAYCSKGQQENIENPPIYTKRLEHSETSHTIKKLQRFHLYVVQVRACNQFGCGSFGTLAERTNYSITADKIYNLSACRVANSHEYQLSFNEPQHPNSLITSYMIHFRLIMPAGQGYQSHLKCITRREHADNNYSFIIHKLAMSYDQVAVRVNSLASHTFIGWVNVTICDDSTKLAGTILTSRSSKSWNIFLLFFLLGAGGTSLWIFYKRRCWHNFYELRRLLPIRSEWSASFVRRELEDDRQILVDDCETVRFQNSPLEELKYTYDVVIIACARTPCVVDCEISNSSLPTSLGVTVTEAVIKRSAIDIQRLKKILITESPNNGECVQQRNGKEFGRFGALTKHALCPRIDRDDKLGFKAISLGLKELQVYQSDAVIVGTEMISSCSNVKQEQELVKESLAQYGISLEQYKAYLKESLERFLKAQKEFDFEEEVAPLQKIERTQQSLVQKIIKNDVISFPENETLLSNKKTKEASALILSTASVALELNLKPLAILADITIDRNTQNNNVSSALDTINKFLAKTNLTIDNIHHWEIADESNSLPLILEKVYKINSKQINPHGDLKLLGSSAFATLPRLITHLAYTLKPGSSGCAICSSTEHSVAVLIKKLPTFMSADTVPVLTLYTKKVCPLCDVLLEELDMNFAGLYKLQKIFIDCKENVHFLRLYRHDIPVLFLNGHFLCMHRLNVPLLKRKLELLNKI
uniref:receptor protein-tyrosine kinase n=1 Tax=Glossina brevipalpis TaxID=37001 RepID=A0A1A9W0N7_9MUSC